jgi:putative lipase involved disintegration of autophagic bodies
MKPNPFGVTATESGRSPMVSMRYLLDQRCWPGIVYPAINVISWRLDVYGHRIHPLLKQVVRCGKVEKMQSKMVETRGCHNGRHLILSSGFKMYLQLVTW